MESTQEEKQMMMDELEFMVDRQKDPNRIPPEDPHWFKNELPVADFPAYNPVIKFDFAIPNEFVSRFRPCSLQRKSSKNSNLPML